MTEFNDDERKTLLTLARCAIEYGATHKQHLPLNLQDYSAHLCLEGASFVTLEITGQLRGCIGSLEAHQPLVIDVARNAYAAAFQDPRFEPVNSEEVSLLEIHISVLSKPESIDFISEADLLNKIRPGIDGLILNERGLRGTFLPAVWKDLPDKKAFLEHLKMKAGLSPDYWSQTLKVFRYTTEMFGETEGGRQKTEERI